MLRTLKALLIDSLHSDASSEAADHSLPLAVAALLFEISRADHEVDDVERETIAAAVARVCDVPAEEIATLLAEADDAVEESVSIYEFTSVVNEQFDRAQKYELLVLLWRVAYADGRVDHYEEYFVRKITDLLHLSQSDFIRAKHQALE